MYYKFLIRKLERSCQGNAVTMLRKHALVYESTSAKAEFPNMLLSMHKHDSVYIWLFLFPKCTLICPAITIQLPIGRGWKFFICKISIFICFVWYYTNIFSSISSLIFLLYFIPLELCFPTHLIVDSLSRCAMRKDVILFLWLLFLTGILV